MNYKLTFKKNKKKITLEDIEFLPNFDDRNLFFKRSKKYEHRKR